MLGLYKAYEVPVCMGTVQFRLHSFQKRSWLTSHSRILRVGRGCYGLEETSSHCNYHLLGSYLWYHRVHVQLQNRLKLNNFVMKLPQLPGTLRSFWFSLIIYKTGRSDSHISPHHPSLRIFKKGTFLIIWLVKKVILQPLLQAMNSDFYRIIEYLLGCLLLVIGKYPWINPLFCETFKIT